VPRIEGTEDYFDDELLTDKY